MKDISTLSSAVVVALRSGAPWPEAGERFIADRPHVSHPPHPGADGPSPDDAMAFARTNAFERAVRGSSTDVAA